VLPTKRRERVTQIDSLIFCNGLCGLYGLLDRWSLSKFLHSSGWLNDLISLIHCRLQRRILLRRQRKAILLRLSLLCGV